MEKSQWTEKFGATALVTGASSGIGEQFARQLAQKGFDLLLTARRDALLQALKMTLERDHGINVTCVACDLGDPVKVDALIAQAQALHVGLVVSNAGYGVAKGAYLSVEREALDAMYRVNCLAPARIAHALLPAMVARRQGGFIFTGSMEGEAVFPWSGAYAASKAFLHSLVQALWWEVKDSDVKILLLAPGSTDTQAPLAQGISREQLVGVMSPAEVAGQALAALGRQPLLIPGLHNRLFVVLLRLLPRKFAIGLAGFGMKRAIEQSSAH